MIASIEDVPPTIAFQEYDPAYPAAFDQLAAEVRELVGEVDLEHVGSTSVRGLAGRRVLDAVIVEGNPSQRESIVRSLRRGGFHSPPFVWIETTLTTTVYLGDTSYPVLLYVLEPGHPAVSSWLRMREHWRNHPEEAARYAQVMRDAIAQGRTHPRDYQQAKAPYLEDLSRRLAHG